jgi:hypothetical protein
MGPTEVPLLEVPTEPVHPSEPVPPLAVQLVAPVEPQEMAAELPVYSVEGVMVSPVTAGTAGVGEVTVTFTDWGALAPPGPVQASE